MVLLHAAIAKPQLLFSGDCILRNSRHVCRSVDAHPPNLSVKSLELNSCVQ